MIHYFVYLNARKGGKTCFEPVIKIGIQASAYKKMFQKIAALKKIISKAGCHSIRTGEFRAQSIRGMGKK